VDPRTGLDDVEKRKFLTPPGLELRRLGRPARSQSLYRLPEAFKILNLVCVKFSVALYGACEMRCSCLDVLARAL
jgi:hypothetical protein